MDGKEQVFDFSCGYKYPLGKNNNVFFDEIHNSFMQDKEYFDMQKKYYCNTLFSKTGLNAVLFNSKLETLLYAIYIARNYSKEKYNGERREVLVIDESLYKRVQSTFELCGDMGLKYACSNHLGNFISAINERTSALLIEPINAETFYSMPKDFLKQIAEICIARDIALISVESCAFPNRVNGLFSYMQYDIKPDIVVSFNGVANGLPLDIALANDKYYVENNQNIEGVIICGANKVLSYTSEQVEIVKKRGKALYNALKLCKDVKDILGQGLNYSIKVLDGEEVKTKLLDNGIKVDVVNGRVVFAPSLDLTDSDFNCALLTIKKVLRGAVNPFDI